MRKKRRKPIYKPDYAGVHQIAVAKRIVGVLLVLTLIAGIAALAVTWAVPSIFRALQPSPIKQEEKEQAIIEELEAEGDSVVRDPETDLPLFENDVNLFLISEEYPDDGSYAREGGRHRGRPQDRSGDKTYDRGCIRRGD